MSETERLSFQESKALIHRALAKADVANEIAASVAHAPATAEAEGQAGHGFSRLADYIAQVKSGKINAAAAVSVNRASPAVLHVDAGLGFAFPAIDAALEAGLPIAREMGVVVMAVGNSHHCGALSVHVERIARQGLIGLMVANTPKAIAPWGAKDAVFGTNPIAFATPVPDAPPLVIDLSLSKVARGKVMAAKKAGRDIPSGWALDAEGRDTTDPEAALAGTMVPIGEAKGTALALMVEVLAVALTGSAFSSEAGSFFHAEGAAPRVGQTLIAIDPGGRSDYGARLSQLLSQISEMEGARLPGERRRLALEKAHQVGIDVPRALVDQARVLAA